MRNLPGRFLRVSNSTTRSRFWACPGFPHCEGTRPIPRELQSTTRLVEPQSSSGESTEQKLRRALYQRQVQERKFRPGIRTELDPEKLEDQEACVHGFDYLKWGGNQHAKYASCGKCLAKNIIFVEKKEKINKAKIDVFVEKGAEAKKPNDVHAVHIEPGHIMLDTGCRRSVAGSQWHQSFQDALSRRGMSGKSYPQQELFRFGDGKIVTSQRT